MKTLYTIVRDNLRENENIYILRKSEINDAMGIMHEFTYDQLFNNYSDKERVVRYWHEEGLCVIINE